LPYVNTDCFNVYLEELSSHYQDQEIILIVDGAGWHKSQSLAIPKNIKIEILPPYCPELNPVEKFWQYIKNHTIKNKVYESLQDLEDGICSFMREIDRNVVRNICYGHLES
jgi:transposase